MGDGKIRKWEGNAGFRPILMALERSPHLGVRVPSNMLYFRTIRNAAIRISHMFHVNTYQLL